jgi:hypothetical protein
LSLSLKISPGQSPPITWPTFPSQHLLPPVYIAGRLTVSFRPHHTFPLSYDSRTDTNTSCSGDASDEAAGRFAQTKMRKSSRRALSYGRTREGSPSAVLRATTRSLHWCRRSTSPELYPEESARFLGRSGIKLHQFGIQGRKVRTWMKRSLHRTSFLLAWWLVRSAYMRQKQILGSKGCFRLGKTSRQPA